MTSAVTDADEANIHGSASKRARYLELTQSPYFNEVVAANRLYLAAAVADQLGSERTHWSLSCLPATNANSRFSTLSMSNMETFVLLRPDAGFDPELEGFVIVSEIALGAEAIGRLSREFGLKAFTSDYDSAEDDQIGLEGTRKNLVRALSVDPLRTAARALATRLMARKSRYPQYHNDLFADRVLGRF
jgi:hypothetical protein